MIRAALLALALCVSTAHAQTPNNCFDDNMRNRCDAAIQQQTRDAFGVQSIEQLASQNVIVRRAFLIDGYGTDMPLVQFERRRGESPRVVVIVLVGTGETPRRVSLEAPVSSRAWNEVIEQSWLFHRALAPESATAQADEMGGCLHSWVATVEASDPGEETPVRKATHDACNAGLAFPLARALGEIAFENLPQCSGLKRDDNFDAAGGLRLCAMLDGDRVAAGEVLSRANELAFNAALSMPSPAFSMLVHDGARVEFPDHPPVSGFDVMRSYASLMERKQFQVQQVFGESSDRVRIVGQVVERAEGDRTRTASAQQIWVRENGFDFRLRSMRVEAFGPWIAPRRR